MGTRGNLGRSLQLLPALGLALAMPSCGVQSDTEDGDVAEVAEAVGVEPVEEIVYNLVSRRSIRLAGTPTRCADIPGDSKDDGIAPVHEVCTARANQRFYMTIVARASEDYGTAPKDGDTVTFRAEHSGKCLDVWGTSQAQGISLIQWACHDGANQRWRLQAVGGGAFQIVAVHSNQCLSRTPSAPWLIQSACTGSADQRWILPEERPLVLRFAPTPSVSAQVLGKGLDGFEYVFLGTYTGAGSQRFYARGADGSLRSPTPGEELVLVAEHSGQCVDVKGTSLNPGAAAIQWPCHGGANQIFEVQSDGDAVRLVAKHSGQCLTQWWGVEQRSCDDASLAAYRRWHLEYAN